MGSEFSYEDLISQDVDKYTYRGFQEEQLKGKKVAVMECYLAYKFLVIPGELHGWAWMFYRQLKLTITTARRSTKDFFNWIFSDNTTVSFGTK